MRSTSETYKCTILHLHEGKKALKLEIHAGLIDRQKAGSSLKIYSPNQRYTTMLLRSCLFRSHKERAYLSYPTTLGTGLSQLQLNKESGNDNEVLFLEMSQLNVQVLIKDT